MINVFEYIFRHSKNQPAAFEIEKNSDVASDEGQREGGTVASSGMPPILLKLKRETTPDGKASKSEDDDGLQNSKKEKKNK